MLDLSLLFLVGRPNAGKSTQARLLVEAAAKEGGEVVLTVSPGDWLRTLREGKDDLGAFVQHNWNHEALSPLVIEFLDRLVADTCAESVRSEKRVLLVIDGYPRTVSETTSIPAIARGCPTHVAMLETNEVVARARAGERNRDDDDTEYALDIRNEAYTSKISVIVRELEYQRIRYSTIDATQPPETVLACIQAVSYDRIAIPSAPTAATLANRYFHEASAMDRARISQMAMRLAESKRLDQSFFGTHPVSLTRLDLPRIRRFPYLVSLKAEGVRFMCLVSGRRLWLISRKLRVFAGAIDPALADHDGTLLDGELMGEEEARLYLVLDVLAKNGRCCCAEPILARLVHADAVIAHVSSSSRLCFRRQEYVDRTQLSQLLARGHELPWSVDGIILQPARLAYRNGIDYNMFKWKPLGENSVDLYYNASDDGLYAKKTTSVRRRIQFSLPDDTPEIQVKKHTHVRMGRLFPEFLVYAPWVRDGMILECVACPKKALSLLKASSAARLAPREVVWFPKMHRGDKPAANLDWVAQSVIQSIADDITQEELQRECVAPPLSDRDLSSDVVARVPKRRLPQ